MKKYLNFIFIIFIFLFIFFIKNDKVNAEIIVNGDSVYEITDFKLVGTQLIVEGWGVVRKVDNSSVSNFSPNFTLIFTNNNENSLL